MLTAPSHVEPEHPDTTKRRSEDRRGGGGEEGSGTVRRREERRGEEERKEWRSRGEERRRGEEGRSKEERRGCSSNEQLCVSKCNCRPDSDVCRSLRRRWGCANEFITAFTPLIDRNLSLFTCVRHLVCVFLIFEV